VDDSVTVVVTLTPSNYTWDFGDGRKGSNRRFAPSEGLGRAYTDPRTPSPVRWSYEFDSRDFAGGFPVSLTIRFGAVFSANGGPPQALPDLTPSWTLRLPVCQVQPIGIAPGSQRPSAPCRDGR
jgi:hypothetical protein